MQFRNPFVSMLFLLAVVLMCNSSNAQTITNSNFELDERGFDYSKVMGEDDDGFFVLQSNLSFEYAFDKVGFKMRKYRLIYFDYDLRPVWKQELSANMKDQSIEKVFYACNRIVMVMKKDGGNNRFEYYLQWINNKGSASYGNTKSFEIQFGKNSEIENMNATVSENKEQTLLLFTELTAEKKQIFHFIRIDTLSIALSKNKLVINEKPDEFTPDEFDISDSGEIALTGVYLQSGRKKNNMYYGVNRLYILKPGIDDAVVYDFELPDKNIADAGIVFDNKNKKLIMTGLYFDKASNTGSGIAYGLYDAVSGGTANIYFNPLTSSNSKIKGERNSAMGAGLMNYNINKLVPRSDGGVVVLAEAILISETSYYDYFTQTFNRRVQYNYNNVLSVSVNTDGSIDWANLVRKEQESIDDGGMFSSYGLLNLNEKMMLVYNRSIYQNAEAVKVFIDTHGIQEEKDLVRSNDHLILMPRYGKQVSAEEFIMPAMQKKRMVLTKISFL